MRIYLFRVVLTLLLIILAACAPAPTQTPPAATLAPAATQAASATPPPPTAAPTATQPPTPTALPSPLGPTETPVSIALPAEPQPVEIITADNVKLEGLYFSAAENPAPIVVLMHDARGDMLEWGAIAPWLQNRGVATLKGSQFAGMPFLDSSWFPKLPDDLKVGVLIFNFRGFGSKSAGVRGDPEGWRKDAEAALKFAIQLPGAEAKRIVAVGSSIGADGAVDACLSYIEKQPGCLGAYSLSPGSYLNVLYATTVKKLGEKKIPVRCLAAVGDGVSNQTCYSAGELPTYKRYEYPGSDHGVMLVNPDAKPQPLDILLEFLQKVLKE